VTSHEKRQYLFDNPRNTGLLVRGLLLVCAILVALDILLHRHVSHPWENLFGFYALFGFVACVLLVLLAKEMRKLVMRDADYYDELPGAHVRERTEQAEGGDRGRDRV